MMHVFRLPLSFIVSLCLSASSLSAVQLLPVDIKQQVETASELPSAWSKTTKQIAQNVLTTNSLDSLFTTYSSEDIFSWTHGDSFVGDLVAIAHPTTKKRILNYLKPFAKKLLEQLFMGNLPCETTPTAMQALHDSVTIHKLCTDLTIGSYQQQAQRIAPLLKSIIIEEKKLNDQGYFTFFHSQRWEYFFGEKLFTDLWALTEHKNRPTNYLFAHVRMKGLDPLEKGALDRSTILQNGRTCHEDPARDVLLFTNNSLFGNYKKRDGGSSLSFFLKNDNRNTTIHLLPQDIFTHYNLSQLYTKHAKELADLQTHFDAANTLGTILMIALPKSMINQYCFSARAGGYKKFEITDTYAFIEELKQSPDKRCNNEEFCIVMLDSAMDPEGGVLIKAFNCAEPTEYKKFETGYEKLIQKLTTELQKLPSPKKYGK
jgi:hypothetical protein